VGLEAMQMSVLTNCPSISDPCRNVKNSVYRRKSEKKGKRNRDIHGFLEQANRELVISSKRNCNKYEKETKHETMVWRFS